MSIIRTRSYDAFVEIVNIQLEARKQRHVASNELIMLDKWFKQQSETKAAHMYAVDEILKSRKRG